MNERISIADKKPDVKSRNVVPQIRRKTEFSQSMNSPVDRILFLQRTIGNQAVGKLIKSGALQAKLRIGQAGDVYEQEADRVAEQVMRMPDVSSNKDAIIQRKCPKCLNGLRGLLGKDKKDEVLQAKGTTGHTPEVTPQTEANIKALKGDGNPLPESMRAFFEPRFGRDFSRVRVHANAQAAESARAVNGLAYTVGNHIVFGAGRYDPATQKGTHLLAHELTHVLQQDANDAIPAEIRLGDARGAAEMEADRVAADIDTGGGAGTVRGGSQPTIARFSDTGHHVVEEAGLAGAGYLFSWKGIPGNANVRLIEFLKQNFGIDWVKTAKIEKIDNGKTIKVSTEKNYLSLKLNDKQTEVNLEIDDGRTDKFVAKIENSKLNIYGGFSKSQIKAVERGNVQRDYSQIGMGLMGRIGNAFLLCKPQDFGGYRPVEHFDNYLWDVVTGGWQARGGSALGEKGVVVRQTPIDYITSELDKLATRGDNDAGLEHLGNAFHTVEDFFAHSNFVELMQDDTRYGATLITGNPVGPTQSVSRILEAISPPGMREQYRADSEAAIAAALPGSHTQIAHDDPTTHNYTVARRLAALVIQDLGAEVLVVMKAPKGDRSRLMRERVVAKLVRYLRPPDKKDKWWETLTAADAGRIDDRLKEAERKTPTMVNQCMISPLKNLEASRDSPMALPLGVAIPAMIGKNQVWFQVGGGVTRPIPFDPLPGGSRPDERGSGFVVGAQITGTF